MTIMQKMEEFRERDIELIKERRSLQFRLDLCKNFLMIAYQKSDLEALNKLVSELEEIDKEYDSLYRKQQILADDMNNFRSEIGR